MTCGSGEDTFHGINRATHMETTLLDFVRINFRYGVLVVGKIQSRDI